MNMVSKTMTNIPLDLLISYDNVVQNVMHSWTLLWQYLGPIPYCDPCLFHRTRTAWLVLAALDRQDLGARGNFHHFIFDVIFTYHHFHRSPFPSFTISIAHHFHRSPFPSLTIHFAPSIAQPSVTKAPQPHEIQSLGTNLRCGAKFETLKQIWTFATTNPLKRYLTMKSKPFCKRNYKLNWFAWPSFILMLLLMLPLTTLLALSSQRRD